MRDSRDASEGEKMSRRRIGEILGQIVPLSGHDIEEILQEKRTKQCRFGEAAISLGMVQPEHIWNAWSAQLNHEIHTIDLDHVGVDMQAVSLLPRDAAWKFGAVPVRLSEEEILVATTELALEETSIALPAILNRQVKFVLAAHDQVQRSLHRYYPREH